MKKFKNWLKFYFLGFFIDKYGKEAAARSFFNVILSLLLTLILISGGVSAGYAMSFTKHYNNAESFRNVMYSVFADDADSRINIKMQDGKLAADIPNNDRINGFLGDVEYSVDDYKLIVDTNPAETTFDDFKLVCKDANGLEISYEDYLKLPEQGKKNGSVTFEYSGKPLDITAKQTEYISYLDRLSDSSAGSYNSEIAQQYGDLNHKKSIGEISEQEYAVEIYVLYAKNYYPSYSKIELYGEAPTLRSYYTQAELLENEDKYIILLDDTFICSFVTDDGITVNFASYYMGVRDSVISSEGMNSDEARANIDRFVKKCFASSGGLIFFVYIINTCNLMLFVVAGILALALIAFVISKVMHLEFGAKYYKALNTVGSYLFYSALFAFVLAIVLSFFYARNTVFTIVEIAFACIYVVRTAVFFVCEAIRKKRGDYDNLTPNEDLEL